MSRTRVKICGLTRARDAVEAVSAGADAIGLVFFEASPRAVTLEQARAIVAPLPPFVTVVGLFVNAERRAVVEACTALPLGLLQFHGEEDEAYCASFGHPWMKVVRVGESTDIAAEAARYARATAILLDTFRSESPGGTGEAFDWARIPSRREKPLVVAGGLTEANVGDVIAVSAPFAVDVSSGVESQPGIKDAQLMKNFMSAVSAADANKTGDGK